MLPGSPDNRTYHGHVFLTCIFMPVKWTRLITLCTCNWHSSKRQNKNLSERQRQRKLLARQCSEKRRDAEAKSVCVLNSMTLQGPHDNLCVLGFSGFSGSCMACLNVRSTTQTRMCCPNRKRKAMSRIQIIRYTKNEGNISSLNRTFFVARCHYLIELTANTFLCFCHGFFRTRLFSPRLPFDDYKAQPKEFLIIDHKSRRWITANNVSVTNGIPLLHSPANQGAWGKWN